MERVYSEISEDNVDLVVAIAPTSYGKTAASPWIWKRARSDSVAGGLIHVAPLRSLVWKAYMGFFKPCGGRLQAYGVEASLKSPYFLSSLVITTLDSFFWNLYRVPVAEAVKVIKGVSMGHYYPALAAVLSSIVVFDEAHMYLWEEGSRGNRSFSIEASLATMAALASTGVPVIVETATLSLSALGMLAWKLRGLGAAMSVKALKTPSKSGSCKYINRLSGELGQQGVRTEGVVDKEWEDERLVKWKTSVRRSWSDALREVTDYASTGPVLVIANTVSEAVSLYYKLQDKVSRILLIHGRLSSKDRNGAENRIKEIESKGGVIVATQVIEAGIDVNSMAVYTAAAPLENLAQRAGRSCRRGKILEKCKREGGHVVIIADAKPGPYIDIDVESSVKLLKEELNRGREIDWRATCDHDGFISYASLIAEKTGTAKVDFVLLDILVRYLRSDAQPWVLLDYLDEKGVCGLARNSLMAEVDVGNSTVVVSLDWLLRNAQRVLEMRENGPVLVAESVNGSVVETVASSLWSAWKAKDGDISCTRLLRSLLRDIENVTSGAIVASYKFKGRHDAYVEGQGLLLPEERPRERQGEPL